MYDLKLTNSGDLEISEDGDVSLTQSVRQAVLIRLRWLFGEWRFAPENGVPYFQQIMVKNPDIPGSSKSSGLRSWAWKGWLM